MKLRFILALIVAKLSIIALKITKHNATNMPGYLALRICPDFIKLVNKPKRIIVVTGTNGKTTVSNLINDSFKYLKLSVLNNSLGSNINTGIAAALIYGVSLFNREKYDIGVFEIDERSAPRVYPYLDIDYLIITNLSRDSLVRNAHPEYIASLIEKSLDKKTKLILNADDMISNGIAKENERVYFGIEKMDSDLTTSRNLINDITVCPHCHSELSYEYLRYSNIGKVYCPKCGFKSPDYDYSFKDVDLKKMEVTFTSKLGEKRFRLLNESVFNMYNELILLSLLVELGYDYDTLEDIIKHIGITKSRYNSEIINDIEIAMQMAKDKNAYACSRAFEYISSRPRNKEIVLMMNCTRDAKEWSELVCWLYEADFELLNRDDIIHVITYGKRGLDFRMRLREAGIKDEKITVVNDLKDIAQALWLKKGSAVYVLYGSDSVNGAFGVCQAIRERIKEVRA